MKDPMSCLHAEKRLEGERLEAEKSVIQVRGKGDLDQGRGNEQTQEMFRKN